MFRQFFIQDGQKVIPNIEFRKIPNIDFFKWLLRTFKFFENSAWNIGLLGMTTRITKVCSFRNII